MKFLCSAANIAIYFSFTFLWMVLFINASQNDIIKMSDELENTTPLLSPIKDDADHDITKITDDMDNVITQEVPQENETMNWFYNLDKSTQDNIIELLSKSIQHYGELTEDGTRDMEEKFGIVALQTQQLYEFLYLGKEKTNLSQVPSKQMPDWLYDFDSKTQDNVVSFLTQSIEHYEYFNEDVIKDMKQKFRLTTEQITNLYESVYDEQIGWNCTHCTFKNDPISKQCEACGRIFLKVGEYIQSIEQFVTITKDQPQKILSGVVMKIEEIDDDGDFRVRHGCYADEAEWISKTDNNKFANLELDVFSNGITIIDLQGCWINSFSFDFAVTDRLYISIINENVFEIEETENEFILNQWILMKKSKTLTWKKGNQEVFWYRTFPSTKYKIEDQNKNDCSCSIL